MAEKKLNGKVALVTGGAFVFSVRVHLLYLD